MRVTTKLGVGIGRGREREGKGGVSARLDRKQGGSDCTYQKAGTEKRRKKKKRNKIISKITRKSRIEPMALEAMPQSIVPMRFDTKGSAKNLNSGTTI